MDVDLDPSDRADLPDEQVGDRVRIEGRLEVDFDPDDYEDG